MIEIKKSPTADTRTCDFATCYALPYHPCVSSRGNLVKEPHAARYNEGEWGQKYDRLYREMPPENCFRLLISADSPEPKNPLAQQDEVV